MTITGKQNQLTLQTAYQPKELKGVHAKYCEWPDVSTQAEG